MFKALRSSLAVVLSTLILSVMVSAGNGPRVRHPAIAGHFLFQQDLPAKTVVMKEQASTPANPSAGWYKLFVDNTGALKLLDSAGGVTTFGAGGGGFELQTETSFTNNSTPAIYLKAPGPNTTPFLEFLDSSDVSKLKVYYNGGVESAGEFYSGTGIYATTGTSISLRTAGNIDVGVFREYGSLSFEGAQPSTSGVPKAWLDFNGVQGNTGITASTEYNAFWYNPPRTYTWDAGSITNQRFFYMRAPTMAFGGASTVTNAATLAISGAPAAGTNATITNPYALWVESGLSRFDGRINTVNSDASNPNIQAQNDTGTGLRGISLSGYGAYLTSRSSIGAAIAQTGTLPGNTTAATALIKREHVLGGFTSTGPVLQVEQATGTGNLLSLVNSGGTQAAFDQNGVLLIGGASSPGTATRLQLGTPTTADNSVNLYLEPTSTSTTALGIQANAGQSVDLVKYRNSAGTVVGGVAANGQPYWSNGVGGVAAFGGALNTTATGVNVVAIGSQAGEALTNGTTNVLIGAEAGRGLTTGSANVVIGYQAVNWDTALSNSVVVGSEAFDQGAIAYTGTGPVLAVGQKAGSDLTTQNNIAVFGSATSPLNDWFFGESYSSASPSDITFQPSVGSGTNIAGSSFYLKGGAGTGNATPGKLYLQYASAGSSGATLQSYTTAVTIDSSATDVAGLLVADKIKGGSSTPSIAAEAGAGTGPTVSLASGSTDTAGEIVVTTGTATASGAFVTVTFASAYSTAPFVTLTPSNSATANIAIDYDAGWYVTRTTTGFTVNLNGALAISTEYKFNYHVVQ